MGLPVLDGKVVQVLGQGASVQLAFTGTSDRVQLAAGWKIVELWCDQDCYVLWGGSGVDAAASTSRPLTARIPVQVAVPADQAYIAAIRIAVSGTLSITDLS